MTWSERKSLIKTAFFGEKGVDIVKKCVIINEDRERGEEMTNDSVRDRILMDIEKEKLLAGSKLPGARELARKYKVSFPMVQCAISLLEQDGILMCRPRRGTFVRDDWQNRLVHNHVVLFRNDLPWIPGFCRLLQKALPGLRFCSGFLRGMFELRTTFYIQQDREQYLDLSPYFPAELRKEENCFQAPFKGFREPDGRLFGIPFIFSPRVMFYNRALLKRCGIPEPVEGWSWEQFLDFLRILCGKLPAESVFNYSDAPYFWMNFIFRAGGKLIDRSDGKEVRILLDSPGVIRGMQCLRQLRKVLNIKEMQSERLGFSSGRVAFAVGDRELYSKCRAIGFDDFSVVPFPVISGGVSMTAQATDLICIRRECIDEALAEQYVQFMLSDRVQNLVGSASYGIPVLKKAAAASFRKEDARDAVFFREMEHISAEYNIDSSELSELIYYGMIRILCSGRPLEEALQEFASVLRVLMDTKNDLAIHGIPG